MNTQTQTRLNEMAFSPQSQLLDHITQTHSQTQQGFQSMHLNHMQLYTHTHSIYNAPPAKCKKTVCVIKAAGLGAHAGNNPACNYLNRSFPQNDNSIIIYSPSCCQNPTSCFCDREIENLGRHEFHQRERFRISPEKK